MKSKEADMGGLERGSGGGFVDSIVLATDLVLARARLSPLAIARGKRTGRMEFKREEGDIVFLEVGGMAVAAGKIVKRGGRSFFKVGRLLESKGGTES